MSSTIAFNYNFRLDDGTERIFTLQLEASTLDLISEQRDEHPAWTALECQQCPNCPLIYEDIQRVNTSFLKRLDEIETRDASANALVILDCFASQVAFSIDEEDLSEFEVFFAPYLQKDEK